MEKNESLGNRFDNKDLNFHTFKKSETTDASGINGMDAVIASPATNCQSSPSCLLVQTESNFAFSRDKATPAFENGDPISPNG